MVAFKASQTDGFLSSPPAKFQAALLYGPDQGVTADRAEQLAKLLASRSGADAEIVRLDDASLAAEPERLAVEAKTLPMFGGRKIIRLKAGQRIDAAVLAELLAGEMECLLVVEAGNLRPTAKLRQIFERADRAAALPCYVNSSQDLMPMMEAELARHQLRLDPDAKSHLLRQLAADPGLARQEIAKLALYAGDTDTVTVATIDAIIGDSSQTGLDALANSVAAGEVTEALRQLDRLLAAGTDGQAVLIVLTRHFDRLHRLAAQLDAGVSARDALSRIKPPLHFRQRDIVAAQLRKWNSRAAARAIAHLQEATRATRLRPDLERAQIEQTILSLAQTFTLTY